MVGYIYLAAAIIFEIIATTLLKFSDGLQHILPTVFAVLGYVGCYFCFAKCLKSINLGVAYATWSAVGIIVSAILGAMLFSEAVPPRGIAGIALLIAGVVLINI